MMNDVSEGLKSDSRGWEVRRCVKGIMGELAWGIEACVQVEDVMVLSFDTDSTLGVFADASQRS